MQHGSRRAKGRRLQVQVAEALSERFKLTIEATKPTMPGTRENGAVYVPEGRADLRIRRMGEAGIDVALLTEKAKRAVAIGRRPCSIECKNHERLSLAASFWVSGEEALITEALTQARETKLGDDWLEVAVVSKNRWPILVAWPSLHRTFIFPHHILSGFVVVTTLERWMNHLDGARR